MNDIEIHSADGAEEQRAEPVDQPPPPRDTAIHDLGGGAWKQDGYVHAPCSVSLIPSARKLSSSAYADNTTGNHPWHMISTASKTDPFVGLPRDEKGSTGFLYDYVLDQSLLGEGVDYVQLEGSNLQAAVDHPEWVDGKTGQSRFVQEDWLALSEGHSGSPSVTWGTNIVISLSTTARPEVSYYNGDTITITSGPGEGQTRKLSFYNESAAYPFMAYVDTPWTTIPTTASTYTITPAVQDATYYSTNSGSHGTSSLSIACGRLYGFAKRATLRSIGPNFGTGSNTARAIILVAEFHKKKADKTRPTVMNVNLTVGSSTPSVANATSAVIGGVTVSIDLSTEAGRKVAQDAYNIPIFSGSETYLVTDNYAVEQALKYAVNSGVIVVQSSGNRSQRLVPSTDPSYNDYLLLTNGSKIYFNRSASSAVPGVINVGAYQTDYINNKEAVATFSNRGALIDLFAPGVAIPAATKTDESGAPGIVPYPGNAAYRSIMFGGTSASGPITAGVAACLASSRKWMTSLDCKAGLIEAAVVGRLYTPASDVLSDKNALREAGNRVLHYPWSHKQ